MSKSTKINVIVFTLFFLTIIMLVSLGGSCGPNNDGKVSSIEAKQIDDSTMSLSFACEAVVGTVTVSYLDTEQRTKTVTYIKMNNDSYVFYELLEVTMPENSESIDITINISNKLSSDTETGSKTITFNKTMPEPTPTPYQDTTPPVPGNDGLVNAELISNTSVKLTWTAATDNEAEQSELAYIIYYNTDEDFITAPAYRNPENTDGSFHGTGTIDVNVDNLTPNTTYYFKVAVVDPSYFSSGVADYNVVKITTDTDPPVPGNEGKLTNMAIGQTSAQIDWTPATDNITEADKLEYMVYFSKDNNIGTLEEMETNGTAFGSYQTDIKSISISELSSGTRYYVNVIVRDEMGNKAAYETVSIKTASPTPKPTQTPTLRPAPTPTPSPTPTPTPNPYPVPGPGTDVDNITQTGITVLWDAATDETTAQGDLEYLVYYSLSNNITTVADMETNGTAVGSYAANITSKDVTGLSPDTSYYFNAIVRDEAGNKAAYNPSPGTTLEPDTTAPVPGPGTDVDNITQTGITVLWDAATDETTAQGDLEYLVYYSLSNNITTVADMETNGTAVGSYAANITSKDVTGLLPDTSYYFNAIVRDEAGNKAAYNPSPGMTLEAD